MAKYFLAALICILGFFTWGFASLKFDFFPSGTLKPLVEELVAFTQGHAEEKTSLFEKIRNDMNLSPDRQKTAANLSSTHAYQRFDFVGRNERRQQPELYFDAQKSMPGYRFVMGSFDFEQHLHGALLFNPQGEVIHSWDFSKTEPVIKIQKDKLKEQLEAEGEKVQLHQAYNPPHKRFPHGVVVYEDGSVIFNDGDQSNGIQKIDVCSEPVWQQLGKHHHAISKGKNGKTVWTFLRKDLIERDATTGEALTFIPFSDILSANPQIDFFQRIDLSTGKVMIDPWHNNDIEPLPEHLAGAFPQFEAGDLLLSFRSLNLVMVVSPVDLKIKWWRIGTARRQHDPDWVANGWIEMFNNNMRIKDEDGEHEVRFSGITAVNPQTMETRSIYDGEKHQFYTAIRGKQQLLPNGNYLLSSPQEGRVFEISTDQEIVWDFQNRYDEKHNLLISEAIWLPEDFFELDIASVDCAGR